MLVDAGGWEDGWMDVGCQGGWGSGRRVAGVRWVGGWWVVGGEMRVKVWCDREAWCCTRGEGRGERRGETE